MLAQSSRPIEHIVVDGGSTDGRVLKAGAGIHRGRVPRRSGRERRPNRRIPYRIKAAAQGEMIALLNSDDWYEPSALTKVKDAFAAASSELGIVVAPVNLVCAQDGDVEKTLYPKCPWLVEIMMPVPHPGCFVRREVYFSQVGLFDCRYKISADYDFIWRCRKAGVQMAYLPDPLVNMEIGGLANRSRRLARRETLSIARRHSRFPAPAWIAWGVRALVGR